MPKKIARRSYDSHPNLPFDPDSDRHAIARPIHADTAHIAVVALGAFFGTLARYELGVLFPTKTDGWPMTTLLINVSGAFVLGLLLQMLLNHGRDAGKLRALRLLLGTGFLGAFTTYSSLATSAALLMRDDHVLLASMYILVSVIAGIIAAALGIRVAEHRGARS